MNIHLTQNGCRLNYGENHLLARNLRRAGHWIVDRPETAQVIVVNTCAVTAAAGQKSRQLIRAQHKANPGARIVATGCYTTLEPDTVAGLPGVWKTVGNEDKDLLAALLEEWSGDCPDLQTLERMQPAASPFAEDSASRTRAFVKVQDGCRLKCAFCVVTIARGESRSKPAADVVAEIRDLAEEGFQEAVLTGVHLGSYGEDQSEDAPRLAELVSRILGETEISRLRLSSLEPWNVDRQLFDCWREWPHRLCPHLHLPLQAGTDAMLRSMGRRCSVASFADLVQEARRRIPGLTVTTDIIVGFPGETDGEFAEGLEYISEMRFADAHVFPFSPRRGTRAAELPHQISNRVKKSRLKEVQLAVDATGQEVRAEFLGQERPVLWEGRGRQLAGEEGILWSGYTDNYLKVETVTETSQSLGNRITSVRLDELQGQMLTGRPVRQGEWA